MMWFHVYDGRGPAGEEEEKEHLSAIIKVLNERFGLQLTLGDQLLFDQFEEGWVADDDLSAQARANSLENFKLVFADTFMKTIVRRIDDNEGIFQRILGDHEFQGVVMDHYLRRVFDRARSDRGSSSVEIEPAPGLRRAQLTPGLASTGHVGQAVTAS